ncbi:diacylglycerol kinase [Haloactinopolyspora alba]|uniref:Diacylglycerol kinase n=1 Tax=Haloactinopolyspora alba TaxID=648780 RepID=A0A2P8DYA7_9ACTN|nr:diacylglycerol kinase [Haloactinopolyspora alba]PSL02210.1 diacylglycerol kinase [Haloactinopolyspora alba]
MSDEVALLVNPAAGRGRGARAGRRAAAALSEAGVPFRVLAGRDVREAGDLAAESVESGARALVVVGGDGMAHLGLQALGGADTPLGIIPAGTGNDLARALGLPLKDAAAAAAVVAGGVEREIDLGRTDGQWFAGVVAAGFDARVNDRVNRMRWPKGPRRYDVATFAELGVFRPIEYHIELDDEVLETEAMLVAVGNVPSYGGGLRITPEAEPDNGLFDVLIVAPVSRMTLVRAFNRVRRGTHLTYPFVSVHRAGRVKLDAPGITAYVDGERLGPLPRIFDLVPRAQRVYVPVAR